MSCLWKSLLCPCSSCWHVSNLLVFLAFLHPTFRLLVAPRTTAGVFFWLNCLKVSCAAFFFIVFLGFSKSWHFCFQVLFSDFGFSCSTFVSSILVFVVGILFHQCMLCLARNVVCFRCFGFGLWRFVPCMHCVLHELLFQYAFGIWQRHDDGGWNVS